MCMLWINNQIFLLPYFAGFIAFWIFLPEEENFLFHGGFQKIWNIDIVFVKVHTQKKATCKIITFWDKMNHLVLQR